MLSTPTTARPPSRRRRARAKPMKPAAPVIRTASCGIAVLLPNLSVADCPRSRSPQFDRTGTLRAIELPFHVEHQSTVLLQELRHQRPAPAHELLMLFRMSRRPFAASSRPVRQPLW